MVVSLLQLLETPIIRVVKCDVIKLVGTGTEILSRFVVRAAAPRLNGPLAQGAHGQWGNLSRKTRRSESRET